MRKSRSFFCTPIRRLLQVEHFIGRVVPPKDILAVGILHRPRLTTEASPLGVEGIDLCHGHLVATRLGGERLKSDITPPYRLTETYGLPTVASHELTLGHRRGRVQVRLVARVIMCARLLHIQLIQFRTVLSEQRRIDRHLRRLAILLPQKSAPCALLSVRLTKRLQCRRIVSLQRRSHHVEDDHLVLSLLEPAARHIECLLRTDRPEPSDGTPIDIDLSFPESLHVQIRVAHLIQLEITPIVARAFVWSRQLGRLTVPRHLGLHSLGVGQRPDSRLVVVRNRHDGPSTQIPRQLMPVSLSRDGHTLGDTLIVLDSPSEVDTTHRLQEDLQFLSLPDGRQSQTLLVPHTIDLADIRRVDEHLSVVVAIVQREHTLLRNLRQHRLIDHRAPALIHLFHGPQLTVHHQRVDTQQDVSPFRQLKRRNTDKTVRERRALGQWHVTVFLQHLTQLNELLRLSPMLVDRRVVVVRGDIRCETRTVGPRPVSERGTPMSHIKREADAL